ncbi:DoxX family protein [Actinoplanes sp. NPDC020271]|uniref:DoxX family protein n=1 Tax=Actinoplanes sp. NPDC020271 TaxID=3363896 RepID=UPI0037BA036A
MNVVLWIIAGLLAAAFLAAGAMKMLQPKEKLIASGLGWAADFSDGQVKLIGLAEVLGAVGLLLPALLDVAPVLVPMAATGLAITMIGAIVVHVRRKENQAVLPSLILLVLSAVVAWGRFGPWSF